MAVSQAKENILKKIRQALAHPVPLPFPHGEGTQSVFTASGDDTAIAFAQEFTRLQGKFSFCASITELQNQLYELVKERQWKKIYSAETEINHLLKDIFQPYPNLSTCDVSITSCE